MGDLLCAAPVIFAELQRGQRVHLLLFPNATLLEFCSLIDFSPHTDDLLLHSIPASVRLRDWSRFLQEMRAIDPNLIWISPHAPKADSSWKVPLTLWLLRLFFWRRGALAGADTERLAWLLDKRLPVDRTLPIQPREWSAYRLLRGPLLPELAPRIGFIPEVMNRRKAPATYDLVIHPGANAANRKWPLSKYAPLLNDLPAEWKLAFLGLPDDLAEVKKTLSGDRVVSYVAGTIRTSIETLASARFLLVMDSGNMHFAQVLGVPAIAVFGYTNPADIIDPSGVVQAIYEQQYPCQPCRKATCSQPEVYCLTGVEPAMVAGRLRSLSAHVDNHQLLVLG